MPRECPALAQDKLVAQNQVMEATPEDWVVTSNKEKGHVMEAMLKPGL
jgi:hypothetical protein